ncbi:MAG: hypothetical protein K5685_09695 [Bacteroidales bacterium]|nr:hypothetical protein [Bacteroidales bacterium]
MRTIKAIQTALKPTKNRFTRLGIDTLAIRRKAFADVKKFNDDAVKAAEEIIALYESGDFDGDRAVEREISDRHAAAGEYDPDHFWCAVDYHATMWGYYSESGDYLYAAEINKRTGMNIIR